MGDTEEGKHTSPGWKEGSVKARMGKEAPDLFIAILAPGVVLRQVKILSNQAQWPLPLSQQERGGQEGSPPSSEHSKKCTGRWREGFSLRGHYSERCWTDPSSWQHYECKHVHPSTATKPSWYAIRLWCRDIQICLPAWQWPEAHRTSDHQVVEWT